MAASWTWWEELRVQHHLEVQAFGLVYERQDRRSGATELKRWTHGAFLEQPPELPVLDAVLALLRDPDQDPGLREERARQQAWVRRWESLPLDPELPGLRPRPLHRLDSQDFRAVLRGPRALLMAHPAPLRVQGPAGERALPAPYHFASSGFVLQGRFVLEQHGQVFVLDPRGQVLGSSFGMGGWGIGEVWRLLPLGALGPALVCRAEDPHPEDRHPALAGLVGARCLLRWDLEEGLLGRWPLPASVGPADQTG